MLVYQRVNGIVNENILINHQILGYTVDLLKTLVQMVRLGTTEDGLPNQDGLQKKRKESEDFTNLYKLIV